MNPAGNRGPLDVCPVCRGRAWFDPAARLMVCKGRVEEFVPHEFGRRPVYGPACGWSAPYAAGCCGDGVNRFVGEPGGGLEA